MHNGFIFATLVPVHDHMYNTVDTKLLRGSVVFLVDPFLFIEISPSAIQSQAISVGIEICLVGFSVLVRSEAGLVRVLLAVGDVCLIEVRLYCVTSRSYFRVIQVTPSSDSAVIQSMVLIDTAPIVLTLCRAAS